MINQEFSAQPVNQIREVLKIKKFLKLQRTVPSNYYFNHAVPKTM